MVVQAAQMQELVKRLLNWQVLNPVQVYLLLLEVVQYPNLL